MENKPIRNIGHEINILIVFSSVSVKYDEKQIIHAENTMLVYS